MRIVLAIIGVAALTALVAACGGDGVPAEEPEQIEGPAMIMFYTDG